MNGDLLIYHSRFLKRTLNKQNHSLPVIPPEVRCLRYVFGIQSYLLIRCLDKGDICQISQTYRSPPKHQEKTMKADGLHKKWKTYTNMATRWAPSASYKWSDI